MRPLAPRDGRIKLHVFVDACSVGGVRERRRNSYSPIWCIRPLPVRGVEFLFVGHRFAKIGAAKVWTLKSELEREKECPPMPVQLMKSKPAQRSGRRHLRRSRAVTRCTSSRGRHHDQHL
jgi:hypothetical protein